MVHNVVIMFIISGLLVNWNLTLGVNSFLVKLLVNNNAFIGISPLKRKTYCHSIAASACKQSSSSTEARPASKDAADTLRLPLSRICDLDRSEIIK